MQSISSFNGLRSQLPLKSLVVSVIAQENTMQIHLESEVSVLVFRRLHMTTYKLTCRCLIDSSRSIEGVATVTSRND